MNPSLDLRTVTWMAGLMGCLMAILMQSLRRNYPPSIRGLREWSMLPVLHFGAGILMGLRDHIPMLLSAVASNAMLIGALLLTIEGLQLFYGRPSWQRRLLVIWLLALIPLTMLREYPFLPQRAGTVSGILGALFAIIAWQIWSQDRRSLPARFLLGVLGLLMVVTSLRSSTIWIGDLHENLFEASLIQSLYIAGLALGTLLIPLGLILLASDRLRHEILQLATHDPLTGLLSRRALFENATQILSDSQARGQPLALMVLDLDHFKQINDTYGHQIGDRVLMAFAHRLQAALGHTALIGRYGGEEFIALLPDLSPTQAHLRANQLLEGVPDDPSLPAVTVSVGLVHFHPDYSPPNTRLDDLIRQADAALYRAKHLGRNRIEEA